MLFENLKEGDFVYIGTHLCGLRKVKVTKVSKKHFEAGNSKYRRLCGRLANTDKWSQTRALAETPELKVRYEKEQRIIRIRDYLRVIGEDLENLCTLTDIEQALRHIVGNLMYADVGNARPKGEPLAAGPGGTTEDYAKIHGRAP